MRTPSFVNTGTWVFSANNVANPTNLALTAPTRAVGDLLLLVTTSRSNTATVATPTGYNLVSGFPKASGTASGGKIYVFSRIATNTSADSVTPSWSGVATTTTGDSCAGVILAFRDATETVDATTTALTDTVGTGAVVLPSITTATDKSLVVSVALKVQDAAQTWTIGAAETERSDSGGTTTGTGHTTVVTGDIKTTAGASVTANATPSSATSGRLAAVTFALKALTVTQTGVSQTTITPNIVTDGRAGLKGVSQQVYAVGVQSIGAQYKRGVAQDTYNFNVQTVGTATSGGGPTDHFGTVTTPLVASIQTIGRHTGIGVSQTTITASVVTQGKRIGRAVVQQTFTPTITVAGVRIARGVTQQTYLVSIQTIGAKSVRGITQQTYTANIQTIGRRVRFGSVTAPFVINIAVVPGATAKAGAVSSTFFLNYAIQIRTNYTQAMAPYTAESLAVPTEDASLVLATMQEKTS